MVKHIYLRIFVDIFCAGAEQGLSGGSLAERWASWGHPTAIVFPDPNDQSLKTHQKRSLH